MVDGNDDGPNPTDFGSIEDYYNEEKAMDNGQCIYCGGALICVGSDADDEDAIIICCACKKEA